MSTDTHLNIDGQRLWNSLMELARIGATPKGGNCRLALSREDGQGRDLVTGWMREAGLQIHVDEVGNIFGIRPGSNPALAPIAMGSHIDTQPTGGKFDGCYGVLAGLDIMRVLQENKVQTEPPLALIIWTNEEGSRFVPVMMGSGVHCGIFPREVALQASDLEGHKVEDELRAIGYQGTMPVGTIAPAAYLEAHIEQGPILEAAGNTIGVVTGSLGLRWFDVTVTGMEAHAGPTPMSMRKDALYSSAALMREIIAIAHEPRFAPDARATIGQVQVHPNSRNVIAGQVQFSVDLRHPDPAQLDAMEQQLRQCVQAAGQGGDGDDGGGCVVELKDVQAFPSTPFAPALVDAVERSAQARGYPHQRILTGAGHDAVYMARATPTAMIFVPCRDGISHNEAEYAEPAHLEAGANVMLDVLMDVVNARR